MESAKAVQYTVILQLSADTFWFWIIYIGVKAFLSALVGIPAFLYQLVKTILAQSKINRL